MVLLRAKAVVQQDRCHSLPNLSREPRASTEYDQRSPCRCASAAYEASDAGLLSPELAASIRRVKGVKKLGVRLGNWLTADEARRFWQTPDPATLKGKRDRAILAVLLGCGLRRRELADLDFTHLQQREEHWAIVDLLAKVDTFEPCQCPTGLRRH